ncbi:hypothetical protein ACFLTB_01120 [Chloroflexota bacterium]
MKPSLKNPKRKVEWAKEQFDILNTEIINFQKMNPPRITDYEDLQNALYIRQFEIPLIDIRLAIIAGDAISNLRSTLDHIAWQLALTTTERPLDRTCFPILDKDTSKKMSTFKQVTRDIPTEAVNEIKLLQPYQRGDAYKDDILWKLDKLCNITKHRVIPAQGTAVDSKIPKINNIRFGTFNNKPAVFMPISVKTQMKFAPKPTFDIVFGSEVDGLVISYRELPNIYNYIRDTVLPKFVRFFSE